MKDIARLEALIKELPPELYREAEHYLEFLLSRKSPKPQATPTLTWRGALRHLKDRYTSVDLQHKAQEWWGD
jgi:hypothetical protein